MYLINISGKYYTARNITLIDYHAAKRETLGDLTIQEIISGYLDYAIYSQILIVWDVNVLTTRTSNHSSAQRVVGPVHCSRPAVRCKREGAVC